MATIVEQDIYSAMSGYASLANLVGSDIYPLELPQSWAGDYAVVYQRVSGQKIDSLSGFAGLERPRFQVNCYGSSYSKAKACALQVMAAWENANFAAKIENDIDAIDPVRGLYMVIVDFSVWADLSL
jgi:hypothetical protein